MTPQARQVSLLRMVLRWWGLGWALWNLGKEIAAAYEDREIDAGEELRLTGTFIQLVRRAKPPG